MQDKRVEEPEKQTAALDELDEEAVREQNRRVDDSPLVKLPPAKVERVRGIRI